MQSEGASQKELGDGKITIGVKNGVFDSLRTKAGRLSCHEQEGLQ